MCKLIHLLERKIKEKISADNVVFSGYEAKSRNPICSSTAIEVQCGYAFYSVDGKHLQITNKHLRSAIVIMNVQNKIIPVT